MYKPKHFQLFELVPEKDFKLKQAWLLWALLDERMLITADQLRERYGRASANTWHWSKDGFQNCGWRASDCTTGAEFSQHKFGRGLDLSFADVESEEIRQDIKRNEELLPFINSIEEGVNWFHFDVRNCERIKWFKP